MAIKLLAWGTTHTSSAFIIGDCGERGGLCGGGSGRGVVVVIEVYCGVDGRDGAGGSCYDGGKSEVLGNDDGCTVQ